ncbi:hypothetical protein D9758_008162 [Tetrapyrgos nigripes]|uniref:Uncharacterized protein n=1 Tax=Tetrapyrgos nigripes TaxID=182062 RepID=A0A8H5GHK0_9AGAR|nr:hypothetical protein D9758_008162 [Tetrapyrgos nigripes]
MARKAETCPNITPVPGLSGERVFGIEDEAPGLVVTRVGRVANTASRQSLRKAMNERLGNGAVLTRIQILA